MSSEFKDVKQGDLYLRDQAKEVEGTGIKSLVKIILTLK